MLHCQSMTNSTDVQRSWAPKVAVSVITAWDAVQVELHGCYSVDRMRDLRNYSRKVTSRRTALVLLLTPLPCLMAVAFADCIPLEPPSRGIGHSSGFWIRSTFATWVYTIATMEQLRFFVPELPLTGLINLSLSIPVMLATNGVTFLLAWTIGYPLPFTIPVLSIPWATFMTMALWFPLRRYFRSQPQAIKRVLQFLLVALCQMSLLVIYPAYNAAFFNLSTTSQALFALLLPIIKLVEKNLLGAVLRHADDLKPEIIIFNVEIFNALFIACCMQNSNSIGTNIVLVAVDFLMACAALRDLDLMLIDVNKLALKLNIGQDQIIDAALLISSQYPSLENRVSMKLLQERIECIQSGQPALMTQHTATLKSKSRQWWWNRSRTILATNRVGIQPHDREASPKPNDSGSLTLATSRAPSTPIYTSLPGLSSSTPAMNKVVHPSPPSDKMSASLDSTFTRATESVASMTCIAPNPVKPSISALNENERVIFLQKVLQALHMTEYLLLVEYTEVMIPIVYSIYLFVLFHLPNRMFYPQLKHMDSTKLRLTIGNVMMNATCEFISLILLVYVLRKKFKTSPSRQLAFVLDCQWRMVQSKVVLWVVVTLQSTLDHLGADYSFKYE